MNGFILTVSINYSESFDTDTSHGKYWTFGYDF